MKKREQYHIALTTKEKNKHRIQCTAIERTNIDKGILKCKFATSKQRRSGKQM